MSGEILLFQNLETASDYWKFACVSSRQFGRGGGKTALPSALSDTTGKPQELGLRKSDMWDFFSNPHMLRWGVILCQDSSFSNKVVLDGMFFVLAVVHAVLWWHATVPSVIIPKFIVIIYQALVVVLIQIGSATFAEDHFRSQWSGCLFACNFPTWTR